MDDNSLWPPGSKRIVHITVQPFIRTTKTTTSWPWAERRGRGEGRICRTGRFRPYRVCPRAYSIKANSIFASMRKYKPSWSIKYCSEKTTWHAVIIMQCCTYGRDSKLFKGTVLRDRFRKCWRKLTDLGLNKGRGWFLIFSEGPLIFSWNKTSSFR